MYLNKNIIIILILCLNIATLIGYGYNIYDDEPEEIDTVVIQPTNLMFTPTPNIAPNNRIILGMNEISWGLKNRYQFIVSPIQTAGNLRIGIKIRLFTNTSGAFGICDDGYFPLFGSEKRSYNGGLGGYIVSTSKLNTLEYIYGLNTMFIDKSLISGIFLGLTKRLTENYLLIIELSSNLNFNKGTIGYSLNEGIRMNITTYPKLFCDLGMFIKDSDSNGIINYGPYIGITYQSKLFQNKNIIRQYGN